MIKFIKHGIQRMNQRGITKEMIELTVEYGKYLNDKIIFKSSDIKNLLTKEIKAKPMKILDQGGLVVVMSDDWAVITVYNK